MADYVAGIMEGAGTMLTVFKWIGLIFGAIIILSVLAFWWMRKKQYIYTCEIWGMKGGVPDVIMTDKARQVKVYAKEGVASLMYFKKLKKYIKIPERDFFNNNKIRFWFRKDGDLTAIKTEKVVGIPFFKKKKEVEIKEANATDVYVPLLMEDVQQKFAVMKVQYIDEDMRLAHKSTAKIVADMFNIHNWLKQYGSTILMIVAFLILIFGAILWMDSVKDYYGASDSVAKSAEESAQRTTEMNEKMVSLLEKMDTLIKSYRASPT